MRAPWIFACLLALSACAARQTSDVNFVDIDGVRIHYVEHRPSKAGAAKLGRPVVMIHGASSNLRDLELSLLPKAATNRRVLLFDRPGHGYSQRPKGGDDPRVQAHYLHRAARALGAERPIVLGHSYGGSVALAYALNYPEDVSGLVLLAPVSHVWPGGVSWYNQLGATPIAGFLFRRLIVPVAGPSLARREIGDVFPENYYERAEIGRLFRPEIFRANAMDLSHLKPVIREMSLRYAELEMPMRILSDVEDRVVYTSIHSIPLSRQAKNARLKLLTDTGHIIPHAAPDAVLDAIDDLEAEISSTSYGEGPPADGPSTAFQGR